MNVWPWNTCRFLCKEVEVNTNRLWAKQRNVTLRHSTMECADNGRKLADTGCAHTRAHAHAHTQTRLTYIYNTSLAGSRCLKSSNIVVGTVTKRNLQRSILKNDTLPKHTIWLVSCWGFNGVIYLLTILWEIWTNLQLHMSFVFIFVSQKMHHVGIKKKKKNFAKQETTEAL